MISTETFEHFAEPKRESMRIVALLRPGGYLCVVIQFQPGPSKINDWRYVRDPTHVAFYSHTTMDWICRAFGLRRLC